MADTAVEYILAQVAWVERQRGAAAYEEYLAAVDEVTRDLEATGTTTGRKVS